MPDRLILWASPEIRVSRPKSKPAKQLLLKILPFLRKSAAGMTIKNKKEALSMTYTKDTIIGDILDKDPGTAPYFLEIGMHCLGCPSSRGETIAEACMVHGTNVEALLAKLNAHNAK